MAAGLAVAVLKAVALALAPVLLAVALYSPSDFSPAALPPDYTYGADVPVPRHDARALASSERVGEGRLLGPEDLAYDPAGRWLYTGCADGWVRRVSVPAGDVEDWAEVGSRPLGLALAADGSLVVADPVNGLVKVNPDRTVERLADEAEGVRFALTDGVDVAPDGTIYFTDASQRHGVEGGMLAFLEARPDGRLLSFDPSTRQTAVLARGLYFPNGVTVSPDQSSLIYCETVIRRCMRYHIRGAKKGTVDKFIGDLPGFPDNIRYDGEGQYWIGLPTMRSLQWDVLFRHPFARKLMYLVNKLVGFPYSQNGTGVMSVTLDGEAVSMYTDPGLTITTGGLKVGSYLYYASLVSPYVGRIDLTKSSAEA